MKYFRFVILCCFILCCSSIVLFEVNAATLGTNNVCSSTKSKSIGEGKCQDLSLGVTTTSDTKNNTETIPGDEGECLSTKYYVIALIDTSTSMKSKGYSGGSTKINLLNTVFKKFADKIYSVNSASKINYIYFNNLNGQKEYKGGNVLKESDLSGVTVIQDALKSAYNFLETKKDYLEKENYTPMVALFTDGYPNRVVTTRYGVMQTGGNRIGNWYSARMGYYTLLTMNDLKKKVDSWDKISDLKFFTFGIGMSNNDSFAKYLLWPKEEYYNKLSDGKISTESKKLKSIFDKSYDGYEFVAELRNDETTNKIGQGTVSNPEYGFFRGIYTTEDVKINKKNKRVSVVNFDFANSDGESSVTQEFVKLWGSNQDNKKFRLWFSFPNSNLTKKKLYKLEYSVDNGINWKTIDKKKINKTTLFGKTIFTLNKSSTEYSVINLTNIRFTFDDDYKFNSNKIENPLDYNYLFDVVDSSYVGDDLAGFETMIENNIVDCSPKAPITTTTTFKKNTYEPCTEYSNLTVDNKYYVKTNIPLYEQTSSGVNVNNATTCSPVSVNVPIIITNEVNFNFGDIKNGISTYNGGSFSLNNISVLNKIKWYYQNISTTNNFMVNLNYKYVKKKSDGSGYEQMPSVKNVGFDEVILYSNSSCSSIVDSNTFESNVWNEIKINKIVNNKTYNGLIKSIDSNTGESNSNVNVLSTNNSSIISNSNIKNATNGGSLDLKYDIMLPKAWVNSKTQNVIYGDNNPDASIYLDYGFVRFVPFKYSGELPVYLDSNFNFSVVEGIDIKPVANTSCLVNVKPIIYVPDENGNYKFNVRYRSIDVGNPFPKSIPINWRSWYEVFSNKQRIKNSYVNYYENKPLYKITIANSANNIKGDSILYFDWNGINLKGQSNFIFDNFDIFPQGADTGYCALSYWSSNCD